MSDPRVSKEYWNTAAKENAAWYIATGFDRESPEFFESGRREVDTFLSWAGLALGPTDTVLEIGCGVGRMTRRLSELAARVVATDVSGEMIAHARANLADLTNVEFVEVSGAGELPGADRTVNAVFSYITMQHVPTAEGQLTYLAEAIRLIAPGGWVLVQFRRAGAVPVVLDWLGHAWHRLRGRHTLSRAWRGARVDESALAALAPRDVRVDILPFGRRHIWFRGRRAGGGEGM